MKSKISPFFRIAICAACSLSLPLAAQEAPEAPSDKPQPATTADPQVQAETLEIMLEPLTQAELGVEAEGWRDLVKACVKELSDARIASRQAAAKAEGAADQARVEEARKQIMDKLAEMQDEKTALLKRLETVLAAYEEKGGDPSEYRVYAKAVSGVELDAGDAEASASAIRGWLKSEDGGIKWGLGILKFLAIMAVFWVLAGLLSAVVRKVIERHKGLSDLLKNFLNKTIRRTILAIGLLVALSTLGVNVGALLALIGGSAFIIGFALQDTLGNFAAGLMLLIYRPFDVGDVVEVGGVSGKVDSVSLVSTTIKTFDNKVVLVPNNSVWGQVITNATASDERRVDMVFGVGYGDDLAKAQAILEKIVAAQDQVLKDPEPVVKVHELADSSVNFICRPWAKTSDYWDVYWDITRKVKEEFDSNGISIPFPQQDVHLHQAGAGA
jgi:small conductance mechanosensitive channel